MNASAFKIYYAQGTDPHGIAGIFYPHEASDCVWKHETKQDVYIVGDFEMKTVLEAPKGRVMFEIAKRNTTQWSLEIPGTEAPSGYFLTTHQDCDINHSPKCVCVSSALDLDGIYIREDYICHGRVKLALS